jgi:hypothetical protein
MTTTTTILQDSIESVAYCLDMRRDYAIKMLQDLVRDYNLKMGDNGQYKARYIRYRTGLIMGNPFENPDAQIIFYAFDPIPITKQQIAVFPNLYRQWNYLNSKLIGNAKGIRYIWLNYKALNLS